jgi:ribosomal protein S20
MGPGGGRGGHGAIREVITVVAEHTGLQPMDILAQLRDGQSLSDIISANGGDVPAVTSAAVEAVTVEINQAVTDGWITQEQADRMLTNVESRVTDAINGEGFMGRGGRDGRGGRGDGRGGMFGGERGFGMQMGLLELAAEQTGLTLDELWAEIQAGQSLADVLAANNVEVSTFVDAAVVQATELADAAVADGRITQERADRMLENLRERLTDRLEDSLTEAVPST